MKNIAAPNQTRFFVILENQVMEVESERRMLGGLSGAQSSVHGLVAQTTSG